MPAGSARCQARPASGRPAIEPYCQLDHELTVEAFEEVRLELGYEDMRLGNTATNQHLGIVDQSMRRYARERAELWKQRYIGYLPTRSTTGWTTRPSV
jgi:hypothetical protein